MRLFTFLLLFVSIHLPGQENAPWGKHELKSFKTALDFPATPLDEEDEFGDLYAKYEAVEAVDSISHSTYKILAFHHRGFFEKRTSESFYQERINEWLLLTRKEMITSEFLEREEGNVMRGVVKEKGKERNFSAWQMTKVGGDIYLQTVHHEHGDFNKKDLVYFFESLKVKGKGEKEMHRFFDENAAISFEVPIKPQSRRQTRIREEFGDNRPMQVYSFLARDKFENFNYLMFYRNNPAGIVFEDLDTDFLEFQEIYEKAFQAKAKNVKRTMFKGYPASELHFDISQNSKVHIYIVVRGNKLYVFMIEQLKEGLEFENKKKAFHDSIEFLPLKYMPLQSTGIEEDYTIDFPNAVGQDQQELYAYPFENTISYFALDTMSSVSYTLADYKLSPFYTTTNYDSLLQADRDSLKTTEMLMSFQDTLLHNGHAWYMKRFSSDSDMVVYDLMFYRGPHYFELMVCGSSETPDSTVWNFFNSFEMKVEDYTADYIRKDKSDEMWVALESKDSVTFAQAKSTLDNEALSHDDLPKIYNLLEKDYSYDTLGYKSISEILLSELEEINDATTIPFLQKIFEDETAEISFRKNILNTFLGLKTKASIRLFFDYAKTFDAEDEHELSYWGTFYRVRDSLELVEDFSLDLMHLMDHEGLGYHALELLLSLYQDSTILVDTPDALEQKLLNKGARIIEERDLLTVDSLEYGGDIYQLGVINELLEFLPASDAVGEFVSGEFQMANAYLRSNAIKAALKLDFPIPDSVFTNLFAASNFNSYRIMREMKSDSSLFEKIPRSLYDQKYVVEGVFAYDYDYSSIDSFQILEKRNIIKNKKKYILHVVQFNLSDYEIPQVGICTQPSDDSQVSIIPDYFFYDDWNEQEETRKDFVKGLITRFVEAE